MSRHAGVWWLANWLPADKSDVERWLMERGYRAGDYFFPRQAGAPDGRRVAFYYFPPAPLSEVQVDATFGGTGCATAGSHSRDG